MEALIKRSGPIRRLPFLLWGLGLFALKIGIDFGVAQLFEQPYSVLYYVSPMDAPLLNPGGREAYWFTMWGVALPFITVGCWLTLRRLRDARLPLWLVAFFFVPFANLLFFLVSAAVPSRDVERPSQAPAGEPSRGMGAALMMSSTLGAVIALGMVGISVGLLEEYGAALFLGAPTISAFSATLLFCRLHKPKAAPSLAAAMMGLTLSMLVLVAFAIEGIVCILMAMPLAVLAALIGWAFGLLFGRLAHDDAPQAGPAVFGILPIWLLLEVFNPQPAEPDRVVHSVIEIDAPPEAVWDRVLAFEDLPPPTETIFLMGVSSPTGATIEGTGVGAVRRCRFTTGEFVEPITVWDEPRELSFDVQHMPDPMREATLYEGTRPPHLDGYFGTTRGQFLLERLPGDRTRLHGRTWYEIDVFPRNYWSVFAEEFMHTIHLRVMNQIGRLAEQDHAAARSETARR